MGRALRRKLERIKREEAMRNSIRIDKADLARIRQREAETSSMWTVEVAMTCFAMALRNTMHYGPDRIMKVLSECDRLMGPVYEDVDEIDRIKKRLEDETGIRIVQ